MECKDFQELLIQFPYDELNEDEAKLLKDHLKSCEQCLAELKSNQQLFKFTSGLKLQTPGDSEKQKSIQAILNKLKIPQKTRSRQHVDYRIIRIALNTAAVFLIGLFVFQQIEIKRNLESLNTKVQTQENSLVKKNAPAEHEITSYLKDPAIQRQFNISENEFLELIENYQLMKEENLTILRYLQSNHPEVYYELQRKLKENKNPISKL